MLKVSRNQKGFTLIELLIVVAIIGILAAIAIPNLLTAMQRSKQKRTMTDMRAIATAWEARATDYNKYNAAGYAPLAAAIALTGNLGIQNHLTPTYMRTMPIRDGWQNNFSFSSDQQINAATAAQKYQIVSYGKNGAADTGSANATTNFDCDLVYENGSFVVFPEGIQN